MTLGHPAEANPRPSADDVAKARGEIHDRAAELGTTAARLAQARARLEELSASAERAVETYNQALVQLEAARAAHRRAIEQVALADERVENARRPVVAIATESYGGYDLDRPMTAILAGGDGVDGYLYRSSMLHHLGDRRARTLRKLQDAQRVAAVMREQAEETAKEQEDAAQRAEAAKRDAEEAVGLQTEETSGLEQEKADLEKRLEQARSHADLLARQRQEALERRRLRVRPAVWKARQPDSGSGAVAAKWALTQLGKPYVWAGDGPRSYDCSGLTMQAWKRAGINLDHWTGTQWRSGPHVPINDLRRGDLVFFGRVSSDPGTIHHVGIFIGQGLMVHAPQTGDVVRVAPIWRRDLVGATRPGG